MRRSPIVLWLLGVFSIVSACALDRSFSAPALIIFHGDTASISAPASASAGTAFNVSVVTFGGGCTREIARTHTTITGSVVEIRPFNETTRASACTDDLRFLTHSVSVKLAQPGTATIRVIGEQRPFQGNGTLTGPALLERTVAVQ